MGFSSQEAEVQTMIQWLFDTQMREMLANAHRKGVKIYCTLNVNGNNYADAADAIKHWLRMGFDGVRLNVESELVGSELISKVSEAVNTVKPEALVAINPSKKLSAAMEEEIFKNGFVLVSKLSDVAKGKNAGNIWVEIDSYDTERPFAEEADKQKREVNYIKLTKEAMLCELLTSAT